MPKYARRKVITRAALTALPFLLHSTTRGDTATWLLPASGTWSALANWSSIPTASTDAYLSATGATYTATVDASTSVNSVNVTSANATLRLIAGTLTATSGINLSAGSLTLAGGSFAGPLTVSGGAAVSSTPALSLNNSLITFAGPGSLNVGSSSTLGGTGQVVIDNTDPLLLAGITATTNLTIAPGMTVRTGSAQSSSGIIGNSSWALVNQGTISAQTPGSVLTLAYASLTNTGTITATNNAIIRLSTTNTAIPTANLPNVTTSNGGRYFLLGGNINNVGATLTVSASRAFGISTGTTFTGGTISSPDNTPFALHNAVTSSTAVASLAGVDVDAPLLLFPGSRTTLTNSTLRKPVTGTSATLILSTGWSLASTGSISLTSSTLNVNATPTGIPRPISVTGGAVTFRAPLTTAQFNGISRNATTTNLAATLDNSGNTLVVDDTTGPFRLITLSSAPNSVATLHGGTLSVVNPANLLFNSSSVVFDSLSLKGSVTIPNTPVTVTGSLTLLDNARVTLTGTAHGGLGGNLMFSGPGVRVDGAGEIVADDPHFETSFYRLDVANDGFTFGPGITLRTGAGSLALTPYRIEGLASAQSPGQYLAFGSPLTLTGTAEAKNGGTLYFLTTPNNLNTATSTLTGGTFNVYDASTLAFPDGNPVVTSAASITLSGPTSSFSALNSLSANAGSLTLTAGRSFTTAAALTNTGSITLGPSSSLTVTGQLSNPGTITLDPTAALTLLATSAAEAREQLFAARIVPSPVAVNHRLAYAITGSTLTIQHALTGDANLDGALSADDFALLDKGLATGGSTWTQGDFNYDGQITPADYLLLDSAYLSTHPADPSLLAQRESRFGDAYVSTLLASVPEPCSLIAFGAALLPLVRRRRD